MLILAFNSKLKLQYSDEYVFHNEKSKGTIIEIEMIGWYLREIEWHEKLAECVSQ